MQTDNDFLSISNPFVKAIPKEEGGERYLFMESSNTHIDVQNEKVLTQALKNSKNYFLKYGNLDIEHLTRTGAKSGIPNHLAYEVGKPVDVQFRNDRTFVKAIIYSGNGEASQQANLFWDSLTNQSPAQSWFPSVGGAILDKAMTVDEKTGVRHNVIKKVLWSNIGLSKTPVNFTVPQVSTIPFDILAKSLSGDGLHIFKSSTGLTAGYGTDMATLTGGEAMRKQSLGGANQPAKSKSLAADITKLFRKLLKAGDIDKIPAQMVEHLCKNHNVSKQQAIVCCKQFFTTMRNYRQLRIE